MVTKKGFQKYVLRRVTEDYSGVDSFVTLIFQQIFPTSFSCCPVSITHMKPEGGLHKTSEASVGANSSIRACKCIIQHEIVT